MYRKNLAIIRLLVSIFGIISFISNSLAQSFRHPLPSQSQQNKEVNSLTKPLIKESNEIKSKPNLEKLASKYSDNSKNSPYLIQNIQVEANGKSANDAKIIATKNARRQALTKLIEKLKISKNIEKISDNELEQMIKSEQILLEKFSNNNYQATLNISFSKKFINFYLKNKNENPLNNNDSIKNLTTNNKIEKSKLEDSNNKINTLILPVKKQGNNFIIWEEKNDWRNSVEKSLQKSNINSNKEILVVKNEINNLEIINNENFEDLQYLDFEPILIQQKSDNLYLAIFEYDEIENKAKITVKNFSKSPKKTVILNFVNVEFLKYSELIDKVSLKLIEYLLNNKNSINNEANQNNITLDIEINDFESWIKIQQKIINSGLMSNIFLKSISKQKTTISGNYLGNKNKIIEDFKNIDLSIKKKEAEENQFTVSIIKKPINENSSN
jgi:hypothetical protein